MCAVLLAAYGFWRWRPSRVEVRGASMRPTLEPGDWALSVSARRVGRGDVVVLEHPRLQGFEIVKRVTAVAGDPAPEGVIVPEGQAWVEGDDPASSTDSRTFGPVRMSLIRGRVRAVWWPPERVRLL